MPTTYSSAPIIILSGPSTTGKTTIIKEFLRQNSELPPDKRLEWLEDGTDIDFERKPRLGVLGVINAAIANSKVGKPTIIDFGTAPANALAKLKEGLEKNNLICPTFVALTYLDFRDLAERIHQRNLAAEQVGGDPKNKRDILASLSHFSQLFGKPLTNTTNTPEIVGTLANKDLADAINISTQDPEEAKEYLMELRNLFGFQEGLHQVDVYARPSEYDKIYTAKTLRDTVVIASDILRTILERRTDLIRDHMPNTSTSSITSTSTVSLTAQSEYYK